MHGSELYLVMNSCSFWRPLVSSTANFSPRTVLENLRDNSIKKIDFQIDLSIEFVCFRVSLVVYYNLIEKSIGVFQFFY